MCFPCIFCFFFQDFCHGQVMWPPLSALQVRLAEPGRSCKQVCQEEQLICEPSFFQHLNKDKDLARWGTHWKTTISTFHVKIWTVMCGVATRWQHNKCMSSPCWSDCRLQLSSQSPFSKISSWSQLLLKATTFISLEDLGCGDSPLLHIRHGRIWTRRCTTGDFLSPPWHPTPPL